MTSGELGATALVCSALSISILVLGLKFDKNPERSKRAHSVIVGVFTLLLVDFVASGVPTSLEAERDARWTVAILFIWHYTSQRLLAKIEDKLNKSGTSGL